jgi:gliding motility-associated-like protein
MTPTYKYYSLLCRKCPKFFKLNFKDFQRFNTEFISVNFSTEIRAFQRYTEGVYKLKFFFLTIVLLFSIFNLAATNSVDNSENLPIKTGENTALTAFTFDCNNPTITGTFYASGVAQLGFITLRINNVTSGLTNIFVTGNNGFSGGILGTPLSATQTSIQIPISFNGSAGVGSYALSISSPDATNACSITVTVVPCTNFKPTITTNAPTILCIGDSVRLTATAGSRYVWSTGETAGSILSKTAGAYSVTVINNGCTGIANQSVSINTNCETGLCSGTLSPNSYNITFGKGARTNLGTAVPGATTTHIYSPSGLIIDGQYAVSNNAIDAGGWAANTSDHSGDGPTGRLMVINADNTPKECFRFPVRGLASNLKYQFSAWIKSISNKPEKPNVTLEVRDALTDSLLAIKGTGDVPFTGGWIQYGLTFLTPNNPNLIVVLRNNTRGGVNGNDLVIDDIQFAYCGPPVAVVSQGGTFDINTGDVSSCAGRLIVLKPNIASGYISSPVFQWQESLDDGVNWRDIVGATSLNYSFTSDSTYAGRKFKVLVAESGKLDNASARVESNITTFQHLGNVGMVTVFGSLNLCTGDSLALTASGGAFYSWNTGETTATINKKTEGTYTVTITSAEGCVSTHTKVVTMNPRPIATITTIGESDLKTGGTAILTASGGSNYVWSTGERTASISITSVGTYAVTVSNINGCTATALKTLVLVSNSPPVLSTSNPSVLEDDVLTGSVASNASDVDNNLNANSFITLDNPINGTIKMLPDGSYVYKPRADFSGVDSVHYQVCDLLGACTQGTIIFNVLPVNDPPKVLITVLTAIEDTPINFCGVIADKDLVEAFSTRACNTPKGLVNAAINGSQICINYTPLKDFSGIDTVCLLVCDKGGLCDTLDMPLTVSPINDAPSLAPNRIIVTADSTIVRCIPILDSDPQDVVFSAALCNFPKGKTQLTVENGSVCVTYSTKLPNFDKDTICITLCDKAGACTQSLIPVSITPCEDLNPPTINCPEPIEVSNIGEIVKDPSSFIRLSSISDNCAGVNLEFKIPTASDDCDAAIPPTVQQTSGLRSGSIFAKGVNILSFESQDKTGKKSTCRVEIRVSPAQFIPVETVSACLNETLTLQAKVINLANYSWKTPQNSSSFNPSLDVPITSTNQNGLYILSVTMGKNCVFKDTVSVNINASPKVLNDSFTVEIDGVLTDNVLKNDVISNAVLYTLKTRDNATNGIVDMKSDGTFTYKPTKDYKGIDNFTYEVCSELCPNSCQKATVIVRVASLSSQVYTGNELITPNGDAFNEALVIQDFNPNDPNNKSSIVIYSQWGELVYTASPYMNNWKGTFKDAPLPDGTYYYIFTPDPKGIPLKSFITVYR